jgi:hypothetical protein
LSLAPQVAQLSKANGVEIDDSKPYAELWCGGAMHCASRWPPVSCVSPASLLPAHDLLRRMGTHPNCPSVVTSTGQPLSAWLKENPAAVGGPVMDRFGPDLPFLFKASLFKAGAAVVHWTDVSVMLIPRGSGSGTRFVATSLLLPCRTSVLRCCPWTRHYPFSRTQTNSWRSVCTSSTPRFVQQLRQLASVCVRVRHPFASTAGKRTASWPSTPHIVHAAVPGP